MDLSMFKFSVDQWEQKTVLPAPKTQQILKGRFWSGETSCYWSQIPLPFSQVSYIVSCISVIYKPLSLATFFFFSKCL